jgi:hypothetical protein
MPCGAFRRLQVIWYYPTGRNGVFLLGVCCCHSNRVSIGLETGIGWGKGKRGSGLQANVAAAGKISV